MSSSYQPSHDLDQDATSPGSQGAPIIGNTNDVSSSPVSKLIDDTTFSGKSTSHQLTDGQDEFEEDRSSARDRQQIHIQTNAQAGAVFPRVDETEEIEESKEKLVSWMSLPRKDQLLILTLARLSEPLTQTSLGAYLFYQLQSFDPSLPDSTISYQAGIIQAAFPGAQFLTAILWGRFADSEYGGRKRCIWMGLLGTMLSIIGFGFSHSFRMAVCFRMLGGVLNGNIGVMRTMISEIIKEKKYQSRAFIILPMTFNIGVIIGPILGGLLADPVGSYPSIFGPGSPIGGRTGVQWMSKYPYALPNLMSASFLFFSCCGVVLFLEETSELRRDKSDTGLRVGRWIRRHIFRQNLAEGYTAIATDENWAHEVELQPTPTTSHPGTPSADKPAMRRRLPVRRIWTRNLVMTLLSHGFLAMHVGSFNTLWYIYLSSPRYDPAHPYPKHFKPHGFIHFTGGLALPPPRIGLALAILGFIGINLQLFLYPRLSHRLGTVTSYRTFLLLFPITYVLVPFLSVVPSSTKPPAGVSGVLIWAAIAAVLFVQVMARTFALPSAAILVNNCCPHPSVLGTVHGLGQSVSSLTRTFGPIMGGFIFGKGLDIGVVGLAWWCLGGVGVVGSIVAQFVWEGDGHEVLMEGEVRGKDGIVRRVD
ncbi:MFS general substrate transporter [Polyplosphaeria fusca]|uniref:MFS general substrate transporter n=1 Tax=Polyplosphaeria fusca TaxID=682080 RepID=A0A9P4V1Q7_9PLEO|nr:MFS general substrate transporter [Polyplosphaeria fusca]